MCGIAGILLAPHVVDPRRLAAVETMAATLRHRGPDGSGFWLDAEAGIALGHRRLAIIDLSEAGHQPMLSQSGNLVMTFNGETYNFATLRQELEARGHCFRGHSDSEVMLAAFESFDIEPALRRFAGMFALAIWDRRRRILHLVRDRLGEKPLYVAIDRGALLFASELKAIRAVPGFHPIVDPAAIATMLHRGWIPDQQCIYKGVFKVPPGTMLSVAADDLLTVGPEKLRERPRRWWSLAEVAQTGQRQPLELKECELEDELDRLLRTIVRERMVADVPLGAFLSGGIDSSAVVSLMQAQSSRPVRTFTVGFDEASYNEAFHASRVARHLGTEHTEVHFTPTEAFSIIPKLPEVWDEPFADESQIPTLLISQVTRQHVTVALSGDGGDECFAGYLRHFMRDRLSALFALPLTSRRAIASAIHVLSPTVCQQLLRVLPLTPPIRRTLNGVNLHRFGHLLAAADENTFYERAITCDGAAATVQPSTADAIHVPELCDAVSRLTYRDMLSYLPGDILVKLDRASMAASLEARCPFLDHSVVEFAWRLPVAAKVRGGQGKWLLRRVLRRYLPEELCERPKQGFNVPIGAWLAGPLRDWARELLDVRRIRHDGLLDARRVEIRWREHLSGQIDRTRELWAILMLQAWLDATSKSNPPLSLSDERHNGSLAKALNTSAPKHVIHSAGSLTMPRDCRYQT
jgi:asparagine synthase (glutamine-hydrolysing)